jgi:hypothetical protein
MRSRGQHGWSVVGGWPDMISEGQRCRLYARLIDNGRAQEAAQCTCSRWSSADEATNKSGLVSHTFAARHLSQAIVTFALIMATTCFWNSRQIRRVLCSRSCKKGCSHSVHVGYACSFCCMSHGAQQICSYRQLERTDRGL